MAFKRPTLPELIDRIAADIESRLPGTEARLRRSVLRVLAVVLAGALHGLYGFLDWLARQLMPDSAEAEHLARWASLWGIARKPASPATGTITATGVDGSVVPAGTTLKRSDGAEFETLSLATIAAGAATIGVEAVVPGQAGNTAVGLTLKLVSPIAGVAGDTVVAAGGLAGGADIEGDESLRARLTTRLRQPPQGGCSYDYVAWTKEIPGVTRAWVYPQELGIGTVTVRFVRDDDVSIIPDAGEIADLQAHLDLKRPVTAEVVVVAPVPKTLDLTIHISPDTPEIRAAVEAELRDLLRRDASPGATILLSRIREAVSIAAGEADNAVTVPAADFTCDPTEIAVLGVITWI